MATTQRQFAAQMIAQLRVLDPSVSAEIGTPERKIIDTVAQALAENQIDLTVLSGALDIDAKFGTDLDRFLAIFGFARQKGTFARGFATFSRTTAATVPIFIANGTQILAPVTGGTLPRAANIFITKEEAVLPIGETEVVVPIEAASSGNAGNLAANTITTFISAPVLGITAVTNPLPMNGGIDSESDDQLKIRFRATVFRNLAGTEDQYLALAVSTAYTTKANVIGPISRYREYIQVPDVDDATADPDSAIVGNGNAAEYTTALSTIAYSKHVYDDIPYFITNGLTGAEALFYRQDTDFVLNNTVIPKWRGDAYRQDLVSLPTDHTYRPNVTFYNVYTGSDEDVSAVRPSDVVVFEHSYMSSASRNDVARNIYNAVDVYIDGGNITLADAVVPRPTSGANLFTTDSTNRYYYANFRRVGSPAHLPVPGNAFTALFWQPTLQLPDQIIVDELTYRLGLHYWAVEDVSAIGGTVRARNGIEWSTGILGQSTDDPDEGPFTGPDKITTTGGVRATSVAVEGYGYDKNLIDLQAALEGGKQVTTDALAHRATVRYFKLDVTIMYTPGSTTADVNTGIREAVDAFLKGMYFGATIQLSDLLQIIHNVGGVDNVRWSSDLLATHHRVVECADSGIPLLNVEVDRKTAGNATTTEVQNLYVTGAPTGGSFTLSYTPVASTSVSTTSGIAFDASAATVLSRLTSASIPVVSVSGSGTSASPFVVTFSAVGARGLLSVNATGLTGGPTQFDLDFYLRDNELRALPSTALSTDTVAGLIIRSKAQNTWNQL